jgi:hypothetical protein
MAAPRAIRIVRRPAPTSEPAAEARPTGPPAKIAPTPSAGYRSNAAGSERGLRLFFFFAVGLLVIYLTSLGIAAQGPGGLGATAGAWVVFTVIAVVFALVAWLLTLARAPRGAWVGLTEVVVRERFGHLRRFSGLATLRVDVTQRYARSWLSHEPTELVRLSESGGSTRMYLVNEGFFEAEPAGG